MAQNETSYKTSVEDWHAKRIQNLKQEDGWLNLEGLFWLRKGVNTFGSDSKKDCFYDNTTFPKYLGDFILEGDSVVWVSQIDHGAAVNNQVIAKGNKTTIFKWNSDKETAAVLSYNRFKWVVIKREDKIGIRFRNLDAKTLTIFKGIERFPVDEKWKLKAVLEKPQDNFLMISNVLGQTTAQKNAGKLKFEINQASVSAASLRVSGQLTSMAIEQSIVMGTALAWLFTPQADRHPGQPAQDRQPQRHPHRAAHFPHGMAAAAKFGGDQWRAGPGQARKAPHHQPE